MDESLIIKINEFKKFILGLIPKPGKSKPLSDSANGSAGTNFEFSKSDHRHPESNLYAKKSHSHVIANITDITTANAIITYEDGTTETIVLLKKN